FDAARARRLVEPKLRQAELGARQLSVIAGRLFGRGSVIRARLLDAAHGFCGAALPVTGARQRGRIDAADPDPCEMLCRGGGIVEEAKRDPARGEVLLGLVDVARGKG